MFRAPVARVASWGPGPPGPWDFSCPRMARTGVQIGPKLEGTRLRSSLSKPVPGSLWFCFIFRETLPYFPHSVTP